MYTKKELCVTLVIYKNKNFDVSSSSDCDIFFKSLERNYSRDHINWSLRSNATWAVRPTLRSCVNSSVILPTLSSSLRSLRGFSIGREEKLRKQLGEMQGRIGSQLFGEYGQYIVHVVTPNTFGVFKKFSS